MVQLRQAYLQNNPPCLEFEYINGGDLASWMQAHGAVEPQRAAEMIRELAEAVAHFHGLDPPLVHRDLKPANILLQGSGDKMRLKIADFGIGGLAAAECIEASRGGVSPSLFACTSLHGSHTPLYASPEQMRGDPADPADDVHALGVIWRQLLTGDLQAGPPSGRRWEAKLLQAGMTQPQVDLLASCFDSREQRLPDAACPGDRDAETVFR